MPCYVGRRTTRFEHAEEIKEALGLKDFAEADKELEAWVNARAWTTGNGPKAVFNDTVSWLAEREVLLPDRRLLGATRSVDGHRAGRQSRTGVQRRRLRQHPRLARAATTLAGAMRVVLETADLGELWDAIETVASRGELEAAVATVSGLVPPGSSA